MTKKQTEKLKSLKGKLHTREEKKALQKKYDLPKLFCFEVTSKCILDCEFCMFTKNKTYEKRRSSMLSFKAFKSVLDDVEFFTHYIQLSGGEPLLNPELPEMITYARERKISTWLFTNLQLLHKKNNLERLIKAQPTRIVIALDGLDKETYESTRIGGNYETLLSNIKDLVKLKRSTGKDYPLISLQMVLSKKTLKHYDDFFDVARDLGADVATVKPLGAWPEGDKEYFQLIKDDYLLNVGDHPMVRSLLDENNEIIGMRKVGECLAKDLVYIGSGGEVIPCWYIQLNTETMGNINDNSMLSIWTDEKYQAYRDTMVNGWATPLCKKCLGGGPEAETREFSVPGGPRT